MKNGFWLTSILFQQETLGWLSSLTHFSSTPNPISTLTLSIELFGLYGHRSRVFHHSTQLDSLWSLSLIAKITPNRAANKMTWPTNQPTESPKTETSSSWNVPNMIEARSTTNLLGERIFLKCSSSPTQFFQIRVYRPDLGHKFYWRQVISIRLCPRNISSPRSIKIETHTN